MERKGRKARKDNLFLCGLSGLCVLGLACRPWRAGESPKLALYPASGGGKARPGLGVPRATVEWRQLRRTGAVQRRTSHRHVLELLAVARVAQQQAAARHVT